jgi:putative sporulation protein YyaC
MKVIDTLFSKAIFREHYEKFNTVRAAKNLRKQIGTNECVFVCIGTDRGTGDALGPLVGSFLQGYGIAKVYGTLDEPVHAKNIQETLDIISERHEGCKVIAIDACLSKIDYIGYINIGNNPINPGDGVGKVLPKVGDISITGIVNVGGFMEIMILQNTRLSLVMNLAKKIAQTILEFSMQPCAEVAVTKLIESEDNPCDTELLTKKSISRDLPF